MYHCLQQNGRQNAWRQDRVSMNPPPAPTSVSRQVVLSTLSFTLCFAGWGLVSAFAPRFRESFRLSATETAFLVAVPVLLGSLARIPAGILADRFGGRSTFSLLMLLVSVPIFILPSASSFRQLLIASFCLGLAGSSFAVGVSHVSGWSPAERQGSLLGIYGLGTIGQSAAVFFGPVLATAAGWPAVFRGTAVLLLVWGLLFFALARDATASAKSRTIGQMLALLSREKLAWCLGAFYFLTFGGFVAFSIYLPSLLRDEFQLTPADAGFRTAGFVVLATLLRPCGGWLSDKIGGAHVLSGVFLG